MAQVSFLRGTQSNLNGLTSYIEGAFYLTTDSDRLYFAQSSSELVPLNQFIRTVADIASLPSNGVSDGDYYYAKAENVLCIRDGNSWTQLNPDTNTRLNTSTTALSTADGANSNEAKINLTISEAANTVPSGDAAHTATGAVTLKGGSNVTVTQSGNTITIGSGVSDNTEYELKTEAATGLGTGESGAKVVLKADSTGTDSDIVVKSANRNLTVAQNNGELTLTAADQSVDTVTAGFDASGKFKVTVKDATDTAAVASQEITPTITYGKAGATSNATFNNGTAVLDTYTKSQVDDAIDQALSAADAMTYMGTVSQSDAADKLVDNADWGSVYKASTNITSPVTASRGDLIIAEKADGYTGDEGGANSTEWKVIVSADSQTITFVKDQSTGTISVSDGANGAGIKVAAGDHTAVSHSLSGNIITTTVGQAEDYTAQNVTGSTADVTQSVGNNATFTAITAIETDKYGNIVDGSIKTQDFTVSGGAKVDSVIKQVTHTASGASVATLVKDTASAVAKSGSITVTSDNLTITNGTAAGATATGNLKINLEWGSF